MHIWEAWLYTYNDEHELTSKNNGGLYSTLEIAKHNLHKEEDEYGEWEWKHWDEWTVSASWRMYGVRHSVVLTRRSVVTDKV